MINITNNFNNFYFDQNQIKKLIDEIKTEH